MNAYSGTENSNSSASEFNGRRNGASEATQRASTKLADDLRVLIEDAETLIRATASQTGEKIQEARAKMEESLQGAKAKLGEMQTSAFEQGRELARTTDTYVRGNPWESIGVAAGVGFVLGLLFGRR